MPGHPTGAVGPLSVQMHATGPLTRSARVPVRQSRRRLAPQRRLASGMARVAVGPPRGRKRAEPRERLAPGLRRPAGWCVSHPSVIRTIRLLIHGIHISLRLAHHRARRRMPSTARGGAHAPSFKPLLDVRRLLARVAYRGGLSPRRHRLLRRPWRSSAPGSTDVQMRIRTCAGFGVEPQVPDAFPGVDRALRVEVKLARFSRQRLAHPVRREGNEVARRDLRHTLAAPPREIGNHHIVAEVQLGLSQQPPPARPAVPAASASGPTAWPVPAH